MGYVCHFVWWHRTHPTIFVAYPEHKSPQMAGRFSPIMIIIITAFFFCFFFTHDALVCHVASTTEKTWLQTTRDQHMHPSVRLCVLSCECVFSINVKMCDCKRARLEMCLAVELWERNVQKKKNRGMCFSCSYVCGVWFVSLCVDCFKVLGMHRSTGSEQRMQLEAWPSVQHENSTTNLHLCVYFWS